MESYSTDDWLKKGKYITINDHKIFTLQSGQGQPLVLLHGFPTSSWDWHKIFDELSNHYHVIAVDFLGFGFSDKPANISYSIHLQADIIDQIVKNFNLSHIHLLSHDFGDTVAQELLARQPNSTYTIVSAALLNGGLFPETHRPVLMQKLLLSPFGILLTKLINKNKFQKSFSAVFTQKTKPKEEELDEFWKIICFNNGIVNYHKLIRYINDRKKYRTRWVSALVKHQDMLCLINGLEDPISGQHMVDRYKELITSKNIYLLENIGHYPQTESPKEVLASYLNFRKIKTTSV